MPTNPYLDLVTDEPTVVEAAPDEAALGDLA